MTLSIYSLFSRPHVGDFPVSHSYPGASEISYHARFKKIGAIFTHRWVQILYMDILLQIDIQYNSSIMKIRLNRILSSNLASEKVKKFSHEASSSTKVDFRDSEESNLELRKLIRVILLPGVQIRSITDTRRCFLLQTVP